MVNDGLDRFSALSLNFKGCRLACVFSYHPCTNHLAQYMAATTKDAWAAWQKLKQVFQSRGDSFQAHYISNAMPSITRIAFAQAGEMPNGTGTIHGGGWIA